KRTAPRAGTEGFARLAWLCGTIVPWPCGPFGPPLRDVAPGAKMYNAKQGRAVTGADVLPSASARETAARWGMNSHALGGRRGCELRRDGSAAARPQPNGERWPPKHGCGGKEP